MREHLLELRFERSGDLLWRPRRHLVLRRLVIELRGSRASPSPAVGVLLVCVREMELQHSLERSGLRVDGRGERGKPLVRTRLAVGELLHRVFAHEERARGVRPVLGLRRLALDILDNVGDGARQILPLRRLDVFPCLFKVVFCHCSPLQRDGGDKRSDNARDSPSDGNFFHVSIIDKIPSPCNGKNRSPWALCVCNRFLTPHQPSGTSAPPQPSFNRHTAKPQPRLNHPSCRIQGLAHKLNWKQQKQHVKTTSSKKTPAASMLLCRQDCPFDSSSIPAISRTHSRRGIRRRRSPIRRSASRVLRRQSVRTESDIHTLLC